MKVEAHEKATKCFLSHLPCGVDRLPLELTVIDGVVAAFTPPSATFASFES